MELLYCPSARLKETRLHRRRSSRTLESYSKHEVRYGLRSTLRTITRSSCSRITHKDDKKTYERTGEGHCASYKATATTAHKSPPNPLPAPSRRPHGITPPTNTPNRTLQHPGDPHHRPPFHPKLHICTNLSRISCACTRLPVLS